MARFAPCIAVAGALVALAGFAYLVFTQISLSDDNVFLVGAPERWDHLAIALAGIALGLLVVVAAQIMSVFAARRDPGSAGS